VTFIQSNTRRSLTDLSPLPQQIEIADAGFPIAGYPFEGKHLIASYSGCDLNRLGDTEGILQALREATRASGATILNESYHAFAPCGLTAMLLLSESHASIHTYPEHGACFVDLFTCGERCNSDVFDQIMRDYFRPAKVQVKIISRHISFNDI
jgi:S-adenosylmethionine decarboxylase proenzyme